MYVLAEKTLSDFLTDVVNGDMNNRFVRACKQYPDQVPTVTQFIATQESKEIVKTYNESDLINSDEIDFGRVKLPFVPDPDDRLAAFDMYTIMDNTNPRSWLNFNFFYNPTVPNSAKMNKILNMTNNNQIIFTNKGIFVDSNAIDMLRRIRFVEDVRNGRVYTMQLILVLRVPWIDILFTSPDALNVLASQYNPNIADDLAMATRSTINTYETSGDIDNESRIAHLNSTRYSGMPTSSTMTGVPTLDYYARSINPSTTSVKASSGRSPYPTSSTPLNASNNLGTVYEEEEIAEPEAVPQQMTTQTTRPATRSTTRATRSTTPSTTRATRPATRSTTRSTKRKSKKYEDDEDYVDDEKDEDYVEENNFQYYISHLPKDRRTAQEKAYIDAGGEEIGEDYPDNDSSTMIPSTTIGSTRVYTSESDIPLSAYSRKNQTSGTRKSRTTRRNSKRGANSQYYSSRKSGNSQKLAYSGRLNASSAGFTSSPYTRSYLNSALQSGRINPNMDIE